MAFEVRPKKPKPGRDCKNFKPMFWDRGHCKLASKCNFKEQGYIPKGGFGTYCMGVKYDLFLDSDAPTERPKAGCGVKPKTPRPKPRPRPNKQRR